MNVRTKAFSVSIFILGLVSIGYQLLHIEFYIPYYSFVYITLIGLIELFAKYKTKELDISYSSSVEVFIIVTFGYWSALCAIIIKLLVFSITLFKLNKREDAVIKLCVNCGNYVLTIFTAYWVNRITGFNVTNILDTWKLIISTLSYMAVNYTVIATAISLHDSKPRFDILRLDRDYVFNIYNLLMAVHTIFIYQDRGVPGTLLVYTLFLPITQITRLYTRMKSQEEELFIDNLTKTYNYKFFEIALQKKIDSKSSFAIVIIDMDKFKQINDTYGHIAGNKVLEDFAKYIRIHLSKTDIACRFGGDEFCIIIDDIIRAKIVADNLISEKSKNRTVYKGETISLNFSVGVFEYCGGGQTTGDILERADKAMYKAKQEGGNCVVIG